MTESSVLLITCTFITILIQLEGYEHHSHDHFSSLIDNVC